MTPESTIMALWGAWLVSWSVARFWAGRTDKRGGIGAELFFRLLLLAGSLLVFALPASGYHFAPAPLRYLGDALNWLLVALTLAGLSFTWWARIHLGRLWSDWLSTKTGHRVVDTGPYRLVRHPIYLGLVVAAFATALEKGAWLALLGVAILTLAFYTKARREEQFLRAELGDDVYAEYARKTAMLVPFVRLPGLRSGAALL